MFGCVGVLGGGYGICDVQVVSIYIRGSVGRWVGGWEGQQAPRGLGAKQVRRGSRGRRVGGEWGGWVSKRGII